MDTMAPNEMPGTSSTQTRTEVSLGDTSYARLLNNIINKLRKVGCEEVVSLPRIAVMGNQSSGKSSLIEAICQIKVPRASGTCTRCPMEVQLSTLNRPEWSGKVSLKTEHRLPSGVTEWRQRHFAHVATREDVPLTLKRAQLALLNPSKDPSRFLGYSDSTCDKGAKESEITFSKNIVLLEITGAEVDVSFIDLPGIVARVYTGKKFIADIVEYQNKR